jgi:hypothetical protein
LAAAGSFTEEEEDKLSGKPTAHLLWAFIMYLGER